VATDIAEFDDVQVARCITRELRRKGQVFFIHNRIHDIARIARRVQALVPHARLAVAHGRLSSAELSEIMDRFMDGQIDVLVTTTIVESGIDVPNANTLIIHRADQLGLAQLYQLRGRVGRSDKRAYAYLLTPPFHLLTDEALKRLRTIEEFTELGSGYQIALRDLEIRGAGNLFGVEQSGNMDAVGFDLYTKLIKEAVSELREEDGQAGAIPEARQRARGQHKLAAPILAKFPQPAKHLRPERGRNGGVRLIHTVALHQCPHCSFPHILCRMPTQHVIQNAFSHGPIGKARLGHTQLLINRNHNSQATGQHRTPICLDPCDINVLQGSVTEHLIP